jgi:electron transport complex protein RnfC
MHSHAAHKLWHFHGGIHPEQNKITRDMETRAISLPTRLVLPLQQHIGTPSLPLVTVGDLVYKGQPIAEPEGYVSAPIHAPTSGRVVAIEAHPVPHPSGLEGECLIIEPDGQDAWWPDLPQGTDDFTSLSPEEIRHQVRMAGIVGLGGATFPTAVKMNPPPTSPVDTLVINGAECEPYITCDDRLMREQAEDIIRGTRIACHALGINKVLIGIEDNKSEAILHMTEACKDDPDISVVVVPTIYPGGGEKQLIKVLTGREVPSNGLPADIGIVCQNVATVYCISRAIQAGQPLISRIVTVTGSGIAEPANLEVLLGTPISHLIDQVGGYTSNAERLVMGGPMMGFAMPDDAIPVTKGTNCILVARADEIEKPADPMPCIRCGRCTSACPAKLLPQEMYWHARARNFDRVQDFDIFDCIECGCCAAVCPSHIPLVQYYRFSKNEIWAQEREKDKADHARIRHEFRLERIERDKREKAEKLAKKKAELAKKAKAREGDDAEDPKKAAIQAALERAKAKKAATQPANTENLTETQQKQIDDAEARRAASNTDPKEPQD